MDGRLVIEEGDVYDLIALAKPTPRPEVATPGAGLQHLRRSVTDAPILRAVGLKAARANVAHHYDLDERLYRLFLDDDMQYSCAFFERPDMTLDQAQLAKKRLIAAKLLVRPGARVLDIGCGWGGMALYLARVCGADVTGITLSQEQLRVATERAAAAGLADRVRFRLQDYREIDGQLRQHRLGRHVRACRPARSSRPSSAPSAACSRPTASCCCTRWRSPTPAPYNQPFIEKYIFPGGYIPALSEVLPGRREVAASWSATPRSCRCTTPRPPGNGAAASSPTASAVLELYDERFIRMWEFYLAGSEAPSATTHMHVFHLQLAHDQARVPLTRDYIPEAMARLAEAERAFPDYARLHDGPIRRSPPRPAEPDVVIGSPAGGFLAGANGFV